MPGLNEIIPEQPATVRMQAGGNSFGLATQNNNVDAMRAMREDVLTRSAAAPSRDAFETRASNFVANLAARSASKESGTYLS